MADKFSVKLTCCGYDDGYYTCESWDVADKFRESYLDAAGHVRGAIIVEPGDRPLGWSKTSP